MKKFLEKALIRNRSRLYLRVNMFLGIVAVISVISLSLETVASLSPYTEIFRYIEYVVASIFVTEFISRLYVKENRKEYLFSFYGLVDIISFLPTYIGLANLTFIKTSRIVRVLQFLRMSRIAKLSRVSKFSNHNSKKIQEIRVISLKIYGLSLLVAVLLFGSCLYYIEGQKNNLFEDIPSSVFWVATVLLGGGIGNIEFSFVAKLLIIFLQFTSLLLFGLLIAIVGEFVEKKLLGSSSINKG